MTGPFLRFHPLPGNKCSTGYVSSMVNDEAKATMPELERLLKVHYAHKTPEMIEAEKNFDPEERFTEKDLILITYGDLLQRWRGVPPCHTAQDSQHLQRRGNEYPAYPPLLSLFLRQGIFHQGLLKRGSKTGNLGGHQENIKSIPAHVRWGSQPRICREQNV